MKCPNCKSPCPEPRNFCPQCGCDLRQFSSGTSTLATQQATAASITSPASANANLNFDSLLDQPLFSSTETQKVSTTKPTTISLDASLLELTASLEKHIAEATRATEALAKRPTIPAAKNHPADSDLLLGDLSSTLSAKTGERSKQLDDVDSLFPGSPKTSLFHDEITPEAIDLEIVAPIPDESLSLDLCLDDLRIDSPTKSSEELTSEPSLLALTSNLSEGNESLPQPPLESDQSDPTENEEIDLEVVEPTPESDLALDLSLDDLRSEPQSLETDLPQPSLEELTKINVGEMREATSAAALLDADDAPLFADHSDSEAQANSELESLFPESHVLLELSSVAAQSTTASTEPTPNNTEQTAPLAEASLDFAAVFASSEKSKDKKITGEVSTEVHDTPQISAVSETQTPAPETTTTEEFWNSLAESIDTPELPQAHLETETQCPDSGRSEASSRKNSKNDELSGEYENLFEPERWQQALEDCANHIATGELVYGQLQGFSASDKLDVLFHMAEDEVSGKRQKKPARPQLNEPKETLATRKDPMHSSELRLAIQEFKEAVQTQSRPKKTSAETAQDLAIEESKPLRIPQASFPREMAAIALNGVVVILISLLVAAYAVLPSSLRAEIFGFGFYAARIALLPYITDLLIFATIASLLVSPLITAGTGQSIGNRVFRTRLVNRHSQTIGLFEGVLRCLIHLSALLVFGVGYLRIFGSQRLSLVDYLSGTHSMPLDAPQTAAPRESTPNVQESLGV